MFSCIHYQKDWWYIEHKIIINALAAYPAISTRKAVNYKDFYFKNCQYRALLCFKLNNCVLNNDCFTSILHLQKIHGSSPQRIELFIGARASLTETCGIFTWPQEILKNNILHISLNNPS